MTDGQRSVRPVSVGSFPIAETIPTLGFNTSAYRAKKISDAMTKCTSAGFRASDHLRMPMIRMLPRTKHPMDVTELDDHKHHIVRANREPWAISAALELPPRS